MALVSTPYRWLWRTAWKNITHWGWDIRNGFSNIPVFFMAVWWFRSWDWTGMVELLRVSACEMRKAHENGIHVGSERQAQRLLVVEELCRRLLADDYFQNAGYNRETWDDLPDYECRRICEHSDKMCSQDIAYLGKMFRFLRHWWE